MSSWKPRRNGSWEWLQHGARERATIETRIASRPCCHYALQACVGGKCAMNMKQCLRYATRNA